MEQPCGSSLQSSFNFADLCFICTKKLDRYRRKVITVPNDEASRDRLLELCVQTATTESDEIKQRLESVPSLVAVKAKYHKECYNILDRVKYPAKPKKQDLAYEAALQNVYSYIIESEKHQFTLAEFQTIMKDNFPSNEVFYNALKKYFGSDITIVQGRGKQPQFLYKHQDITTICLNWHYDKDNISTAAKETILKVAAGLIKSEVTSMEYEHASYPPASDFLKNVTEDIPSLLKFFLDELIGCENDTENSVNIVRKISIAHSIVSILKPKSFSSSLQLSVGTYIYRKTGSRIIIDILSKLGVSAAYKAIQLYEASSIMDPAVFDSQDSFLQYVFDNTDHNVSTLDGKETFHCLGGIAVYTPCYLVDNPRRTKKLNKMPSAATLAKQKQIRTVPYKPASKPSLNNIEYRSVTSMDLDSPPLLPQHYGAYLWAKHLQVPGLPSWKGFMEIISSAMDYTVSQITCLPFINEPPSNLTTIHTSLHYALQQTITQKQKTCFVTYDQPLYLKARSIVLNDGQFDNIVVRLGGFHLLMSYLGAIGHIMAGSGLDDLWSVIFAAQSTKKMMSGHAYSRSVRAHILTFTALGILVCEAINSEKAAAKSGNIEGERRFDSYKQWTDNLKLSFNELQLLTDIENNDNVKLLNEEFETYLNRISAGNPTAQLWVQYFQSVSVALQFIEAERLGNWKLHLQSVKKMLPLFHASGHFAYAKSAQIYLQDMVDLELKMDPQEYERFTEHGYFTIRRSHKAWSGVWSDMTIEQTLNRFFGTDLKHGRGVTPSVVARYLLGMPAAFGVMDSLESFLNIKSANSEQHTDLSASRIEKDNAATATLLQWLRDHNPFKPCPTLLSLSTGIMGNQEINCFEAYRIGEIGMSTMVGKTAEMSLTKLYKVRNLLNAKALHVDDTNITIDPFMLFQRISLVIHGDDKKMRDALQYELSPYPLSMFDQEGLMRKSNKAEMYKIFKPYIQTDTLDTTTPIVIDGGWLLHHVIWPHSRTFGEIFELYYNYIQNHYGDKVTVVFDGYYNDVIGVKSYERYRRKEKTLAADICITDDAINSLTQTKFLSNTANKVKLVQKLHTYLGDRGITVNIAAEDADGLIINIALQLSELSPQTPITIVGNDVDLMILLIALAPEERQFFFYKVAGGKSKNTLYSPKDQQHLKPYILFAHAFAGCDTTSAFYNKGKKSIIKVLQSYPELKNQIKGFYMPNNTIENLHEIAEKIVYYMYYNKKNKSSTIETLRYDCFKTAITLAKKEVSLATLPPTKSALREHVKRVYYQIQLWIGNNLIPDNWGWKKTQTMYIPVMNTEKPAPENLLELIHCGCNTGCSTQRCKCKKMGLKCNYLCTQCNGQSCFNREATAIEEAHDNSEDEDEPEEQNLEREPNDETEGEDDDDNEDVEDDEDENNEEPMDVDNCSDRSS